MDQRATNVLAAIKRETTPGVAAAAGGGAMQLRILDSPGLRMERGIIQSNERRNDMLRPMGRLGGKNVNGSYNFELTIGGAFDDFLSAIMRDDWESALAPAPISITNTTSVISRSAGSFITDGYRVGDVVTPSGDTNTEHNGLRLVVTAVTALTMTVAGTPLTSQAVARAVTLTRLKKLSNPLAPVDVSYTVEQYDEDIDLSELFTGVKLTRLAFAFRPRGIATYTANFMGIDRQLLVVGTSPWFTNPSVTSGAPLISDDSAIRYNGVAQTKFTSMDLVLEQAAADQPVIGSMTTPDIYTNTMTISGSIAGVRSDFSRLVAADSETEFELHTLLSEPGTGGALGIYLPRVKFGSPDAPFMGGDAAKVETLPLIVAPRDAASGYDASAINFFSTAA